MLVRRLNFQVFIPMALFLRVSKIFECVRRRGMETRFVRRQGRKIDYESLAMGSLEEVRHVFARIVFDTVYPPNQSNENNVANQRPWPSIITIWLMTYFPSNLSEFFYDLCIIYHLGRRARFYAILKLTQAPREMIIRSKVF